MRRFPVRVGWKPITLVSALLCVAAVVTGIPEQSTSQSTAVSGQAAVQTFSQWLDQTQVQAATTAQWDRVARDNTVVVLNSWDYRLIPVLKKANPKVQVWVYKNLSGVRSDDCAAPGGECGNCPPGTTDNAYLSSGVGYCWVKRYHPNWLLRAAATGQFLEYKNYPQTWETDYGNSSYQQQWVKNVLADVQARGWDGVEVDNALTTAAAYGVAARYPTDAAVQAATYSALQRIGPALRAAGVPAVFNVGYAPAFSRLWQRWLGPVDGLEQEYFLSFSAQPNAEGAAWSSYEDELSACVAEHKSCWFHSGDYSDAVTPQTQQYALASYLLITDGRQYLSIGGTQPEPSRPALTLGGRLSQMFQAGGTWLRYFTQGVAVVNPTASARVVQLGATYVDGGRAVQSITLKPASGAVLASPPAGTRGGK
jgi:hypothetical protein